MAITCIMYHMLLHTSQNKGRGWEGKIRELRIRGWGYENAIYRGGGGARINLRILGVFKLSFKASKLDDAKREKSSEKVMNVHSKERGCSCVVREIFNNFLRALEA